MQTGHATLATGQDMLAKKVKELTATLNDFTSGHFQLTFTPGKSRMLQQGFDHNLHRREEPSSLSLRVARQILPPSTPVSSSSSIPPRSLDGPAPCAPSVLEAPQKSNEVPKYSISRKLKTIPEMWREWTVGSMGCPSIEELDQKYEACWHPEHKERQFYGARKLLIDVLRRRAEAKGGYKAHITEVIEEMEMERQRSGASLDKISRVLREERKQKKLNE